MVDKYQEERDDCEIKQVSPVGELALLGKLVVGDHDTDGYHNSQQDATEDNKNILRNEAPGRVASSKKCRLIKSVGITKRSLSTDMISHDIWPRKPVRGLKERSSVHVND